MKTFLMAGVAVVLSAGASFAADMPIVAPEPAIAPEFDWTGAYVGLQAGWARKEHDTTYVSTTAPPGPGPIDLVLGDEFGRHHDGINGGGQIGYLFQTGAFVFGVEGAVLAADFEDIFHSDVGLADDEFRHRVDFIATVSGRIGFAWDRALFYAKGGWAGADFNIDFNDGLDADFEDSDGDFISGFQVGGGIDYAITDNLVLGVEYTFMRFDDTDFSVIDSTGITHDFESDLEIQTINAKLSYRF